MFVQLDAAIRQAAPELDTAIKYRLLSYTVDQDWRHRERPSCRVPPRACEWRGARGVLLPLGVLRPGTSTLMTWDMPRDGDVDTAAVASYARNALATRDHFLVNAGQISAAARARAHTR